MFPHQILPKRFLHESETSGAVLGNAEVKGVSPLPWGPTIPSTPRVSSPLLLPRPICKFLELRTMTTPMGDGEPWKNFLQKKQVVCKENGLSLLRRGAGSPDRGTESLAWKMEHLAKEMKQDLVQFEDKGRSLNNRVVLGPGV